MTPIDPNEDYTEEVLRYILSRITIYPPNYIRHISEIRMRLRCILYLSDWENYINNGFQITPIIWDGRLNMSGFQETYLDNIYSSYSLSLPRRIIQAIRDIFLDDFHISELEKESIDSVINKTKKLSNIEIFEVVKRTNPFLQLEHVWDTLHFGESYLMGSHI